MSRDHIIPRFILREFAINPTENKKKAEIEIYNKCDGSIVKKRLMMLLL